MIRRAISLAITVCFAAGAWGQLPSSTKTEKTSADTIPIPPDINKTVNGVRQGKWRVVSKSGNISEGLYVDGERDGEWITTNAKGVRRSLVTYVRGAADGVAIYYFPDGKVMEKGHWKIDHWEDNYERFYANGNKSCSFYYNNSGKRVGRQVYYHENGNLMYDGQWDNGKINGTLSIYNDNGQKVMERHYDAKGKFKDSQNMAVADPQPQIQQKNFEASGRYTIYNAQGQKESSGEFVNGTLRDGEKYYYNEKGKLIKTEIYKGGKMKGLKKTKK